MINAEQINYKQRLGKSLGPESELLEVLTQIVEAADQGFKALELEQLMLYAETITGLESRGFEVTINPKSPILLAW